MKPLQVLGLLLIAALPMHGADPEQGKFFKVDFTEKELDAGKIVSSHSYSVRASTAAPGTASVRTGSKVPYNNSYIEVGVNFDIRSFREVEGEVSLGLIADISSVLEDVADRNKMPVIRQNKWNSTVSAKIGKTTTIFVSDDLTTRRQVVVELTATPIPH